jgi:hypothetical protein
MSNYVAKYSEKGYIIYDDTDTQFHHGMSIYTSYKAQPDEPLSEIKSKCEQDFEDAKAQDQQGWGEVVYDNSIQV